jgi:hypothetical protein
MTTAVFVYREPTKIVADILASEMTLDPKQVIHTNQKWIIPTNGIFIVVSYLGPSKIICNMNEGADNPASVFTETQTLVAVNMVEIGIMSFDNSARIRRDEVAMALRSLYAQKQQELYAMNIARNPGPFMDTSFLEATKMVTRYTTTIVTTSVNMKTKPVGDYYLDFSRAVPPQLTAKTANE